MSWSVTIDDLDRIEFLPDEIYGRLGKDNPLYAQDAAAAFLTAKEAGLVSATLSGGRTPSPYDGPDAVVISIVGFSDRREGHAVPLRFNDQVRHNIAAGPDSEKSDNGNLS